MKNHDIFNKLHGKIKAFPQNELWYQSPRGVLSEAVVQSCSAKKCF